MSLLCCIVYCYKILISQCGDHIVVLFLQISNSSISQQYDCTAL